MGLKIIGETKVGKAKRLIVELDEGYKALISTARYKKGKIPRFVSATNPYSVENIKLWLKNTGSDYVLLSDEYKNNSEHLKLLCKKHGEFEMSWSCLSNGHRCVKCHHDKLRADKSFNIEDVKEDIVKMGYKPLFDTYINCDEKLDVEDKDGYKFTMSYYNIKRGQTPQLFKVNNPYAVENVKHFLKINNKPYKLLDDFVGDMNKHKMLFQYDEGYKAYSTMAILLRGDNPRIFYKENPHTLDNIKIYVNKVNSLVETISDEYIDNKSIIKLKCKKHGEFEAPWVELKQLDCVCPKCGIEKRKHSIYDGVYREICDTLRNEIYDWKKESMEHSNFKCVVTKERFDVVHHSHSFNSIVKEAIDILCLEERLYEHQYVEEDLTNIRILVKELHDKYTKGVCLTDGVHKEFHNLYGYGDNTFEQFEEFYKLKTNRNFLEDYPAYKTN